MSDVTTRKDVPLLESDCDTCDDEIATYWVLFMDGTLFRLGQGCIQLAISSPRPIRALVIDTRNLT